MQVMKDFLKCWVRYLSIKILSNLSKAFVLFNFITWKQVRKKNDDNKTAAMMKNVMIHWKR